MCFWWRQITSENISPRTLWPAGNVDEKSLLAVLHGQISSFGNICSLNSLSQNWHTTAGGEALASFSLSLRNIILFISLTSHCGGSSLNCLCAGTMNYCLVTILIFNQTWMGSLIVLRCNYSAWGYFREIFTYKSRLGGEKRNKQLSKLVPTKSAARKRWMVLNASAAPSPKPLLFIRVDVVTAEIWLCSVPRQLL